MVRSPCCEKMGLKKGPWTTEEDQILVAYIKRYGHANWRALPRQAGLLRCGKSCRLRWMNYLRPDIKRGNLTKEEEETIIRLHERLGNRWSAIAARLPGRTDNEIKNVWHTHLKKLAGPNMASKESQRKTPDRSMVKKKKKVSLDTGHDTARLVSVSPEQSDSDFSSCATDSSTASAEIGDSTVGVKEESCPAEDLQEIDERFWLETLSMDDSAASMDITSLEIPPPPPPAVTDHFNLLTSSNGDDMDFWMEVFMRTGDLQELSQI
ncbi:unnamed protein product [Musa acuminata subsp. malaccensis]|nr:PREDICTED: myb-related protein Myb4 [Musa acuminata subsp. malaccensis]CAG1843657.1 unnamed protein product [Musa acuminata subsp. malaccensis]